MISGAVSMCLEWCTEYKVTVRPSMSLKHTCCLHSHLKYVALRNYWRLAKVYAKDMYIASLLYSNRTAVIPTYLGIDFSFSELLGFSLKRIYFRRIYYRVYVSTSLCLPTILMLISFGAVHDLRRCGLRQTTQTCLPFFRPSTRWLMALKQLFSFVFSARRLTLEREAYGRGIGT